MPSRDHFIDEYGKPNNKPMDMIRSFHHHFIRESWALYGIAILVILLRFVARYNRFGFRGTRIDDVFMLVATGAFTVMTYGINEHLRIGAGTSFIPQFLVDTFTPDQYEQAVAAAKWILVILQMQIITLWTCKACMITMYLRLMDGLVVRKWLIAVAVYVGLAFVTLELGLYTSCLPIQRRWIPGTDMNCSFYNNFQLMDAILSVTTTFVVLVVGLPVLLKCQLPPRQKCIVLILFGLGAFDVGADIACRVFITNIQAYGFKYYSWYMRVCFVALLVCNLPYTWSLIINCFPRVREWSTHRSSRHTVEFWHESNWWSKLCSCFGPRDGSRRIDSPTIMTEHLPKTGQSNNAPAMSVSPQKSLKFMDAFDRQYVIDEEEEDDHVEVVVFHKRFSDIENAPLPLASNADGVEDRSSTARSS